MTKSQGVVHLGFFLFFIKRGGNFYNYIELNIFTL